MNRRSACAVLGLTLVLLAGCASKTPTEPVRADGTEEAVPAVETLEFAPREAYHLTEIEVQSVEDGAVLTVGGICELSVKGFGCGKTITADGKTCAGAKTGETLVWLSCDYTNLTENEVSPGRLIESGLLRYDSGSAEGKSASFAKLLPGETAEVYFYYAVPESLTESPLILQFTIDSQTYTYEIPADRTGALAPTLPEPEDPEKEPEPDPITLQEPPKQETPAQQEQPNAEEPKQETAAPAQQEEKTDEGSTEASTAATEELPRRVEINYGRYMLLEYDSQGRVTREDYYTPAGVWNYAYTYENGLQTGIEFGDGSGYKFEHDENGLLSQRTIFGKGGVILKVEYYENAKLVRIEYGDGRIEYPDGRIEYPDGTIKYPEDKSE